MLMAGQRGKSELLRMLADRLNLRHETALSIQAYQSSIEAWPENAKAWNNLGLLYYAEERYSKAEACFKKAIIVAEPADPTAESSMCHLADLYISSSLPEKALNTLAKGIIDGKLNNEEAMHRLLYALQITTHSEYDIQIDSCLRILSKDNRIDPILFSAQYFIQLHCNPHKAISQTKNITELARMLEDDKETLDMLKKTPITHCKIEALVDKIALHMGDVILSTRLPPPYPNLLDALVHQRNLVGPISPLTPSHTTLIQQLRELCDLCVCGCLLEVSIRSLLHAFGQESDNDYHYLARQFPSSSPCQLTVDTSGQKDIQAFYERHPYPTWTARPFFIEQRLEDLFSSLGSVAPISSEPLILVAGCGTGQHAISIALTYPQAEVIAIDVSSTSLAYANAKKTEFQIHNLSFKQTCIYDVYKTAQQYDLIEAIGVIHHLSSPLQGCKSLLSALKPHGVLKLGLYSSIARTPLREARDIICANDIDLTAYNLPHIRKFVMDNQHLPCMSRIANSKDFYTANGCIDLILNPLENMFDIPRLKSLLDQLNADIAGFDQIHDPRAPAFRQFTDTGTSEEFYKSWEHYENQNPSTFSGMYSFWIKPIEAGR